MFKILILQRYYNLSDFQIEYKINYRMSIMRFLNLTISDVIASPVRAKLSCLESKTVWNFREQIIDLHIVDLLFDLFVKELEKLGLIVNEGKIIDASFVEVPKQNSKEENEEIKNGQTPKSFDENLNKKSRKDVDARWTQKLM
jgi:transposase, IS5 family